MSCNMCGQCCRMIHFNESIHNAIISQDMRVQGIEFSIENFEFIGKASEIGGFVYTYDGRTIDSYVYKCNLITEENKCSVHNDKPWLCSGYPWYNDGINLHKSQPWPYKGCGYERISYEMRLITVLKHRVNQLHDEIEDKKAV